MRFHIVVDGESRFISSTGASLASVERIAEAYRVSPETDVRVVPEPELRVLQDRPRELVR